MPALGGINELWAEEAVVVNKSSAGLIWGLCEGAELGDSQAPNTSGMS